MKKINWGIIGCGDVTEVKSGPAFNKVPNSALVAVMRRDAAKAEDYARRHGVPRWYSNAFDLINDQDINAIYVATPPSSHEEYALAAIKAGKPVYVEKPMTHTYKSARDMAAAAEAANIKMVVAHYRRQQPRFKKIKELVDTKAIGDVLYARIELCKPPLTEQDLQDVKIAWRVDPQVAGGGLFHDLATHQLDLMYYFLGPIQKAQGVAARQGKLYNADDIIAGTLLFESGTVFNGSWCFNAPPELETDQCEITGTNGRISFSIFSGNNITVTTGGQTNTIEFDFLPHVQQPMIEAVVQYFLGGAANPCTGYEGAEIMRVMEAFTG